MVKTNLCIIGLAKNFTDKMCKLLSSKLDMFYVNFEELIDYNLNTDEMKKICGCEYFKNQQIKEIKKVCSYEDSLIYVDYSLINDENIYEIIKKSCVIIYLKLNESDLLKYLKIENKTQNELDISKKMYKDRDFLCSEKSHISIPIGDDYNTVIDIIAQVINER